MGTAEEVLVIFLSVTLAVFLTLGVVLLAYGIKIASQISRMTNKAEAMVDKVGSTVDRIQQMATLNSVGSFISHIVKTFGKNKHKEGSKDE